MKEQLTVITNMPTEEQKKRIIQEIEQYLEEQYG